MDRQPLIGTIVEKKSSVSRRLSDLNETDGASRTNPGTVVEDRIIRICKWLFTDLDGGEDVI